MSRNSMCALARTASVSGFAAVVLLAGSSTPVSAQQATGQAAVTFHKDIEPILQRSCQHCHRPNSLAPMSLITYEEVRPYARAIKTRTGLRDRQGVMPPWFIEKNIGIQQYKNDVSLSEEQIAMIAQWADNGAPRGSQSDAPRPLTWAAAGEWAIGAPDLVVKLPSITMPPTAPDWWGDGGWGETGLGEDRYVAAVEVKEVTDSKVGEGRAGTIGGLFIYHHGIMSVAGPGAGGVAGLGGGWPVHEVGRNADQFHPDAGKLLRAGSRVGFPNVHMHANGYETTAHLEVAFKFHPAGYKPKFVERLMPIGTGEIDIRPMEVGQKHEAFMTLQQPLKITVFEPHMHAAGVRMCLDAILGPQIQTLSCAGYDHNWVRTYQYADDATPLLPRGTILRVTGYYDNTPANKNVVDPRNWSGLGHRSIDNMNILIMQAVPLTDEQFRQEMLDRRQKLNLQTGQSVPGCPLCGFEDMPGRPAVPAQQGN